MKSSRLALASALAALALVAAGCGGDAKTDEGKASPSPSASLPSTSVDVPEGVELTPPGTELKFGETATVAYEANARRKTVLELTVTSAARVGLGEFSSYVLDDVSKKATPYFVRVKVTNVGTGDLGRTDIPLWVVDQSNTLVHSSSFSNDFKRCPSQRFPASFGPKATTTTCLVYLVPNHGTMTEVSYRPDQSVSPVLWKGTIADRTAKAKRGKKKS